jgi:hypothetical protein
MIVMVLDFPAATLAGQVLVCEKGPVIVMLPMLRGVLPTLFSVIVWGGVHLRKGGNPEHEKVRLVGMNFTTLPVPIRETTWGLRGALSLIEIGRRKIIGMH